MKLLNLFRFRALFKQLVLKFGHSTKQGLDLWTRGLVDSWTLFFYILLKCKKRSIAALDMILLVALPRLTRKKDLTYFLSFVLYNIYS